MNKLGNFENDDGIGLTWADSVNVRYYGMWIRSNQTPFSQSFPVGCADALLDI